MDGDEGVDGESQAGAEIQGSELHAVRDLRALAGGISEIQGLSGVLPAAGQRREDTRSEEVELVR